MDENHDAKQMPIGLLMSLAQHDTAMANFSRLSSQQKENLIKYTTGSATGEEAKNRIAEAVKKLENNNTSFWG